MTKARDIARAGTALTNVDATELGYLDGVTSAVQTQLNQKAEFTAGKNKIINGDFGVWQRGTTFNSMASGAFGPDRFLFTYDGNGTFNITRQSFTPGAAPVAGYESQFFLRTACSSLGTSTVLDINHRIEDVRTFAGQTVTVSFWAKADTARTSYVWLIQQFGGGGSADTYTPVNAIPFSVTTSWQRFTFTGTMPSVSGKTIGTSSWLLLLIRHIPVNGSQLDIWGVQVEAGSVATPFTPAGGGNPQAELALCQRYFEKSYHQTDAPGTPSIFGNGIIAGTNGLAGSTAGNVYGAGQAPFKVTKRAIPTMNIYDYDGTINAFRIYPADSKKTGLSGVVLSSGDCGGLYFSVNNTSTTSIPSNSVIMFNWTASAEL